MHAQTRHVRLAFRVRCGYLCGGAVATTHALKSWLSIDSVALRKAKQQILKLASSSKLVPRICSKVLGFACHRILDAYNDTLVTAQTGA